MGTLKNDLTRPGVELRETHISWVFLDGEDVWKVKKPVDLGFLNFRDLEARKKACEAEVHLNRRLAPDVYLGVVPILQDPNGHHRISGEHVSRERSEPGLERSERPRGLYGARPAGGGRGVGGMDATGSRSEPSSNAPPGSGGVVGGMAATGSRSEPSTNAPPGGTIVDYAVHMRRLPDAIRADVMLAEGRLGPADLRRVAERVARFHAEQASGQEVARFGRPDAIAVNVRENFEQTRESIRAHLTDAQAREIERWQMGVLDEQADRFEARIRQGKVRDGHGDLRLEHVYLDDDGTVTIVDCIEFNERFRYADVCSDVAFLSMDLSYEGRVDLAEHFLAAYAREAGDFDLYALVDFYESYRAYVRGKVSSMLAADEGADAATRRRAADRARRYYLLALSAERRPLVGPAVVAIGGIIASGKSTLAEQMTLALGAPVIAADRTRKQLLGARPSENVASGAFAGAYDPSFSEKVYAEMFRRAGVVLASGRPVIVDASFRSRAHRLRARELARERGVPFRFVECRVDPEVARTRLEARGPGEVSDARADLLDDFVASFEPVTELEAVEHMVIDTAGPLDANLDQLRTALPSWPPGLTG